MLRFHLPLVKPDSAGGDARQLAQRAVDLLERLARGGVELANLLPDAWARTHRASVHEFRLREREGRAAA